ncbi:hypothetical protein GCM10027061_16200 [Nesterenkonia suensis]
MSTEMSTTGSTSVASPSQLRAPARGAEFWVWTLAVSCEDIVPHLSFAARDGWRSGISSGWCRLGQIGGVEHKAVLSSRGRRPVRFDVSQPTTKHYRCNVCWCEGLGRHPSSRRVWPETADLPSVQSVRASIPNPQ